MSDWMWCVEGVIETGSMGEGSLFGVSRTWRFDGVRRCWGVAALDGGVAFVSAVVKGIVRCTMILDWGRSHVEQRVMIVSAARPIVSLLNGQGENERRGWDDRSERR